MLEYQQNAGILYNIYIHFINTFYIYSINYIILMSLPESYWVSTIYKIYKIVYKIVVNPKHLK